MKKVPLPTMGANTERPTTKVMPHVKAAHDAVEGIGTVRLNVELPVTLHRAFKMKALQEGRTIKEVVITFITDYSK